MSDQKLFHIGDILSITTQRMLSPKGGNDILDGIFELLNYMTGDTVHTNQIPRFARECQPYLFEQHPSLRLFDMEWFLSIAGGKEGGEYRHTIDNVILPHLIATYGEFLPIHPIHPEDHDRKHPVDEAQEQVGTDRVIDINLNDDEPPEYGEISWK